MQRMTGNIGFWLLASLSIAVALYSYRLLAAPWGIFLAVDDDIRAVVLRAPTAMPVHALFGATALLLGPFQFIGRLRQSSPRLHRWIGRFYVAACFLAGLSALAAAPHASGGPVASAGFGLLGLAWIVTTGAAWIAAVRRDFATHRHLMIYSFAMTFAAVTLRLQIPLGLVLFGFPDYAVLSPWLSFTAWLPNIAAVWLYTRFFSSARSAGKLAGYPQTSGVA
jgi:uncharacterized membrane protein